MRNRRSADVAGAVSLPCVYISSLFLSRSAQKDNRRRGSGMELLVLVAGCMVVAFAVSFMAVTFEGDSDLWPFGADDYSIAARGQSPVGRQSIGGVLGLTVACCTLMTAGACLVLQHRARSALTTESSRTPIASSMAEPRALTDRCPGVRPYLFWRR